MSDEQSDMDHTKFTQSLLRLQEQHRHLQTDFDGQPQWVVDGIRESVVQRFETCYDSGWKLLRRYLILTIGLGDVPNGPNPVFRLAAENSLLGDELDDWLLYAQARIDTSHDYSAEKAENCLALIPSFIQDAVSLHEILTGQSWLSTPL